MIWQCGSHRLDLQHRGLIMGVLNVTPDSFSDGGQYYREDEAVKRALAMVQEGADIIDVGGESTRPRAMAVALEDEMARVLPVIAAIRKNSDVIISIDTMKAEVATAAVAAGASIINDVSGLFADPEMAPAATASGAGLVLMHMQGRPRTMQNQPQYDDVVAEVKESLCRSMDIAMAAGVAREAIALDPGIGFGKTLAHNLSILRHLGDFSLQNRPVLLGISRKSFIARLLGSDDINRRAWPTVALTSYARERGARILRVHDVRANVEALHMTEAILMH